MEGSHTVKVVKIFTLHSEVASQIVGGRRGYFKSFVVANSRLRTSSLFTSTLLYGCANSLTGSWRWQKTFSGLSNYANWGNLGVRVDCRARISRHVRHSKGLKEMVGFFLPFCVINMFSWDESNKPVVAFSMKSRACGWALLWFVRRNRIHWGHIAFQISFLLAHNRGQHLLRYNFLHAVKTKFVSVFN
jgi:hypothetical protein